MTKHCLIHLTVRILIALAALSISLVDADASNDEGESVERHSRHDSSNAKADELATAFFSVSEIIFTHHLDPPTRQEMLLAGVRRLFALGHQPLPQGTSREISRLTGDEEFHMYLRDIVEETVSPNDDDASELKTGFIEGLLTALDGARYRPLGLSQVEQQLRDNLYVGIGVALAQTDGQSTIRQVFSRGPAHFAGAKDNDLILSVNGKPTNEVKLAEVVSMLRGERGAQVTIVVQQPGSEEQRTIEMIRDVVPLETVVGYKQLEDKTWDYRVHPKHPIAFMKVANIRGSTIGEVQNIARRLPADGFRAVILDLRDTQDGEIRHAAMLADAFLGGGTIGYVRTAFRRQAYAASPDRLLADWPMVLLVNQQTQRQAAWIAQALTGNQRATQVGSIASIDGYIQSLVDLPAGLGAVELIVGELYRADGQPIKSRAIRPRVKRGVPVARPTALQTKLLVEEAVDVLLTKLDATNQVKQ